MNSGVSLTSLPLDVLTSIGSYLDTTSLIELSRVSPSLLPTANDRIIWQYLPLYLPRHYGLVPSVTPEYADGVQGDPAVWHEAESRAISRHHGQALLEKVKGIIGRADAGRWSMVREVTMRPRRGTLHAMLLVLDYVSPYVQKLVIEGATYHPLQLSADHPTRTFEPAELTIRELDWYTTFAALTHLRITAISSGFGSFCRLLVISAPRLVTLEVDFAQTYDIENAPQGYDQHPPTALREIRFSWNKRMGREDHCALEVFWRLLKLSPEVRQINLQYGPDEPTTWWLGLVNAVSSRKHLRDLRWPGPGLGESKELEEVRRLVLRCDKWIDTFDYLDLIPKLEIMYLDNFTPVTVGSGPSCIDFPDPYPSPESFAIFAETLRLNLCLHTIYILPPTTDLDDITLFDRLDTLEQSGQVVANISSICHGEDENGLEDGLVQITFPRQHELVAKAISPKQARVYTKPEHVTITYTDEPGNEGTQLCSVFRQLPEQVLCTLASYREVAVPLEVIREMQEVEGGGVKDWNRRSVQVGDEAWAVLQKWYEGAILGRPEEV